MRPRKGSTSQSLKGLFSLGFVASMRRRAKVGKATLPVAEGATPLALLGHNAGNSGIMRRFDAGNEFLRADECQPIGGSAARRRAGGLPHVGQGHHLVALVDDLPVVNERPDAQRGGLANLPPSMQKLVPPIEAALVGIRFLAGCKLFDEGNQIPVAIHAPQFERLRIWLAFDFFLSHLADSLMLAGALSPERCR